MNRVAVWILGTVSGVMLLFGIMMVSAHGGYDVSTGCGSYGPGPDPQPCMSIKIQQVTFANPLGGGALFSAGLMVLLLAILIGLPSWIASPILAQRRGSSARTAILIVSIISSAFVIVRLVAPLTSPVLSTPVTCLGSSDADQPCFYGDQAKLVALLGIGFAPLLASLFMGMPAWVMALTETTHRKRWGWFVAVLFFSPIAAMLYGFFGAQSQPSDAPPASTLAASGA